MLFGQERRQALPPMQPKQGGSEMTLGHEHHAKGRRASRNFALHNSESFVQ